MRNKKFFAVTGAALLLLAGFRTIPQNPEEMTCGDLQCLAEESIDKLGLPFFATQVKYPGDWRLFARNQWIKEGSVRQPSCTSCSLIYFKSQTPPILFKAPIWLSNPQCTDE